MKRVSTHGDSDSVLFHELLYAGEFLTKLTVLSLVASINEDRGNLRYRMLHRLVRATGIGEWVQVLDDLLTGPDPKEVPSPFIEVQRTFTQRVGEGHWQYEAVSLLHAVIKDISSEVIHLSKKVSLSSWFSKFVQIRNKTRGHGAITPAACARLVSSLKGSIEMMVRENPLFKLPWAYLRQNLSGKYHVVPLTQDTSPFAPLKSSSATRLENYSEGVYIWVGQPRLVELLVSDVDSTDFFVPNGGFNGKRYELHSLITDSRRTADATPFLDTPTDRPPSETEGSCEIDIVGSVFTNMPSIPDGYVNRPKLEEEVISTLIDDRHPIVTLVGQGGIGKTSIALSVLHEIANTSRFERIVWFSARDIDLTPVGPKRVQPRTLTEKEIAEEYSQLASSLGEESNEGLMLEHMRHSNNSPKLFVFDNFETVRSPIDLYQWIDTNIRLPNKAVITTRIRDFKADFPIEVKGMEHEESKELIHRTANKLGIEKVGSERERAIVEESEGHPYVIKIIVGEIAGTGKFGKPSQILARKEDVLIALFERTYQNLSTLAQRVFLTLSGWNSMVPELALEAVVRWRSGENVSPDLAVDELIRMSLIERSVAEDQTDFLAVPMTASLFGKRKLEVSEQKQLIQDDIGFLQELGPTTKTSLKDGIYPRIRLMFKKFANRVLGNDLSLDQVWPMMEFIANKYPEAWLLLGDLVSEVKDDRKKEIECVKRFLELRLDGYEATEAWQRLLNLYRQMRDVAGACNAFMSALDHEEPEFHVTSDFANFVNSNMESIADVDIDQRSALLMPIASLMEKHRVRLSATDLSRLAWLYLHCAKNDLAREVVELGLQQEPYNRYCENLMRKLED